MSSSKIKRISPQNQSAPKKSGRHWLLYVLGVIFLCGCIIPAGLAVVGMALQAAGVLPSGPPGPEIEPVQVQATEAPAPAVAEPTATLAPAPVEQPAQHPRNIYIDSVTPELSRLADGMDALMALLRAPDVANEEWKAQVNEQSGVIRQAHAALFAIEPPGEMAEIHVALLDATADCNAGVDHLEVGLENLSVADMDAAEGLLVRCTGKLGPATDAVK